MPLNGGNPAYYNIVFAVSRYVHSITLLGDEYYDFFYSKNWHVTVGE